LPITPFDVLHKLVAFPAWKGFTCEQSSRTSLA
jgi:hypothetical protein